MISGLDEGGVLAREWSSNFSVEGVATPAPEADRDPWGCGYVEGMKPMLAGIALSAFGAWLLANCTAASHRLVPLATQRSEARAQACAHSGGC